MAHARGFRALAGLLFNLPGQSRAQMRENAEQVEANNRPTASMRSTAGATSTPASTLTRPRGSRSWMSENVPAEAPGRRVGPVLAIPRGFRVSPGLRGPESTTRGHHDCHDQRPGGPPRNKRRHCCPTTPHSSIPLPAAMMPSPAVAGLLCPSSACGAPGRPNALGQP
jgi:hypothetical protein